MPPIALKIKLAEMEASAPTAEAPAVTAEDELFALWADIDLPLMSLAKIEHTVYGDTARADRASRKLNELLALAIKLNNELVGLKEGLDKLRSA